MKTQTFTGTVLDTAGEPWADALVELQFDDGTGEITEDAVTGVTDASGNFSIEAFNNTTAVRTLLVRLPNGNVFTHAVDPSDDTVAIGTVESSGGTSIPKLSEVPSGGDGVAWGSITGTIANQSDLQDALNERIPVESAGMDANIDVISDGGARLRLDDTANVMSATGTSGFNASEEVMTIGDWNGSNNSTVLRVDDNAQTVEVDAPAGLFVNSQEVSPFGFRDIVSTADVHVYPAASNSRTYYRIAGDNRTFHLPTTSLIAGKTMFYVTFTGSMGLVDAGAGFTVDAFYFDGTPSGAVNQRVIQAIFGGHMFMVWYIGSNNWASTIINSA